MEVAADAPLGKISWAIPFWKLMCFTKYKKKHH